MRSKRISLLLGLAALWSTTSAQASEVFPGALQEAAGMQCVPVCLMCHTTNPGTANTWTKPLGAALFAGGMRKGDTDSLTKAFKAYAANQANAAAVADIKAGREPGAHVDVCGPTYGCAVPMVAKQPARSRDYTAALWIVSAMVVGGILRRRRKMNAS